MRWPASLVCVLYFFVYYCADTLYADIPFGLATVLFVLSTVERQAAVYGVRRGC